MESANGAVAHVVLYRRADREVTKSILECNKDPALTRSEHLVPCQQT
jgi:hypothetical protein